MSVFPLTLIQKVISFLILYLKSPEDIHPLLGQEAWSMTTWIAGVVEGSSDSLHVAWRHSASCTFYRLWLTATGLREGGYKVSSSAAWGVTITLTVLFLVFGMAIAAIFPSFLG